MIVGCGDLTILLLGLGFHCFLFRKRKTASQPWQAIAQRFCSISIYMHIIWKIIAYRNINLHSLCTKYAFIARSIILLILSSRKLRFFILRKTLCFNVFNASLCFSCKKILLRAEKVKYYKMLVDIKEK